MEGQWQWGEWWRQASGEYDDDSINRMGGVVIGIGPRLRVKTPHEKWQLLNYLVTKIDGGELGSERINARLNLPIQFGFLIEFLLSLGRPLVLGRGSCHVPGWCGAHRAGAKS